MTGLKSLTEEISAQEEVLKQGGGPKGIERQKRLNRLTARERLNLLLDRNANFFELGIWAGYQMYERWGELPAAGVVCGIGRVSNRNVMIIANDATVAAGALFPQSVKKVLRAQRIAYNCRLPIIYLVDSSGVFLPLQDEIFPDEDDFGRIFRNNAVLSASGIPQLAAIMGNCIAGGGYLPVLCDKLLMTRGSGLYIAGPALVKSAIGQEVDSEALGGSRMHSEISGTVDFEEEDDPACIQRLRHLVGYLPEDRTQSVTRAPELDPRSFYQLVGGDGKNEYDAMELLKGIADAGSISEYKAEYGKTVLCCFAKLNDCPVGMLANQRKHTKTGRGAIDLGGVLYPESADKAARFVMNCNQDHIPLLFFQDVMGFMVGKAAEESGIIRRGAKLVNAVSNSIVPKITVIVGNTFGAGHYAMCGKAYDPDFILSWPNAKYSVMGAEQAADTLVEVRKNAAARNGKILSNEDAVKLREEIHKSYLTQMDIRYGAARGWVDAIIAPHTTRDVLIELLQLAMRRPVREASSFHTGVLQV
jgi:3-methylcrotonyl-CoA carboxylase beta subunit